MADASGDDKGLVMANYDVGVLVPFVDMDELDSPCSCSPLQKVVSRW